MKKHIIGSIVSILIAEAIGALSIWITGDVSSVYRQIDKPPLSPPGWLFPAAWISLYALMGIAAYIVFAAKSRHKKNCTDVLYIAVNC